LCTVSGVLCPIGRESESDMDSGTLLEEARRRAGLSLREVASRAGILQEKLSAYECGDELPTLDTAVRVLTATGHDLVAQPRITFTEHLTNRGRLVVVPNALPRLPVDQALTKIVLPLHVNWSEPGRVFNLADRRQRARVYELVLREGREDDVRAYVDGALLVDLWDELVLPREIRSAWAPVVMTAVTDAA